MSQYNEGTVNIRTVVTSDIHGLGTAWSGEVSAGDLFKIDGSDVIYTVALVASDSDLTLSSNYVGPIASGIQYQITRDFTPNYDFPEVHRGDYDWPVVVTQALRDIDNQIHSDAASVLSDLASAKSDLIVNRSDIDYIASDAIVMRSDIDALASDAIYDRLLIAANTSDVVAARSDVFNAIQASISAYDAMDTANVSDVVVGIGEILSAFSDALSY
ncbi:hypothetical protein KAR91_20600 [Candidatus Pacearchaeota archaeon]|nr:hypothetical protein [Candidatus Pacearchaeota archaeon]